MSGRLLNATLVLTLSAFPALGLLLLTVVGPFAVGGWVGLLIVSALGSAALVLVARRAGWSEVLAPDGADPAPSERAGTIGWIAAIVAVVAFVPTAWALFGSPRVQISHHGYFHSAYVYQVAAGHVPPENVTLPGHPTNTYWPYHALLAAMVGLLGVPAPLASTVLNVVLLVGTLGWSYAIARELYGPVRRGLGVMVATFGLFGANLLGGVYWLLHGAAGMPLEPRTTVLLGDVRLATLLAKFANYTGAALGVYFYVFTILFVLLTLRGRARGFDLVLAVMALLGAFALHAITGAFILAGFVLAGIVAALLAAWLDGSLARSWTPARLLARARAITAGRGTVLRIVVATVVLVVLAAPVLWFMASASSEFPEPPHVGWPDFYALSIVATSYPLLPFFVAGVVHGVRTRDARLLFLALVCLGGYALASVVSISGRNEYKFIYLGSVALCLVSLDPILRLLRERPTGRRRLVRGAALVALVLPCWNVALFGIGQLRGPLFADRTFAFEGRHVTAVAPDSTMPGTGLEYADLFAWVRDHTPAETVIVVPMIMRDQSVLYVLSERVPYVVDGLHYNRGLADFTTRAALVETLYGRAATPEERAAALNEIGRSMPDRPLVLIYPRRFAPRFDATQAGLERVQSGKAADLYRFPASGAAGSAS